jgi:hypothetical protein
VRDAGGGTLGIEGSALASGPTGAWLAWLDRPAASLVVGTPAEALLRQALGDGEPNAPVLATSGEHVVAALVSQRGAAREHRLFVLGESVRELFRQPEALDDGLGIAVVGTRAGVLVAWDEERPRAGGSIVAQFVPQAALAAAHPMPAPRPMVLSPEDQDAVDPELMPMPDGSALLVWLASRELDAAVANQSATDIYARLLSPTGEPTAPAVRLTPGPAIRFGVAALARRDTVWIAYRVAGDADHESRGDGGAIAVLALGRDLRPRASAVHVTEAGAVPSGAPVLLGDGDGVTVFWTEREGEGVRTLRRFVDASGRARGTPQEEPVLGGDLPVHGEREASTAVLHGPQGEPAIATVRCPPAVL